MAAELASLPSVSASIEVPRSRAAAIADNIVALCPAEVTILAPDPLRAQAEEVFT